MKGSREESRQSRGQLHYRVLCNGRLQQLTVIAHHPSSGLDQSAPRGALLRRSAHANLTTPQPQREVGPHPQHRRVLGQEAPPTHVDRKNLTLAAAAASLGRNFTPVNVWISALLFVFSYSPLQPARSETFKGVLTKLLRLLGGFGIHVLFSERRFDH